MKIYAIRDRLIDYFMTPFAAPGDKDVLSSLAQTINNGGDNVPIAQAPHHYEIWSLAEVDDQGNLTANKELLADASSLIRSSLRPTSSPGPGTGPTQQAADRSQTAADGHGGRQHAEAGPVQGPAPTAPHTAS